MIDELERELGQMLDDDDAVTEVAAEFESDAVPTEVSSAEVNEAPAVNVSTAKPTSGNKPNVKFAASGGLRGKGKPFRKGPLNIGRVSIMLPDEETQKAGFYTEHAGVLVDQFPQYKFVQEKGKEQAQKTIKS